MFRRLREGRRESGASAVELALLLPFLTALLFGMLQYGFYFYAKQSAVAAVREGARRSAVGDLATCGNNPTSSLAPGTGTFRRYVYDQIDSAAPNNQPTGAFTISRTLTKGTGNSGTGAEVGDVWTVTVQFKAMDIGLIPLPGSTIRASTQTRVENVGAPAPAVC
jgi:Flp pilus assembly protein TadG